MKVLLIVLVIAVVVAIGWFVARTRAHSSDALPAEDHTDALPWGRADDTAIAPPPDDITESAMGESPLPAEPEPEEHPEPIVEPEVVAESTPPVGPDPSVEPLPEPEPIVEPEPPMEPEPIIEPQPEQAEPEPEPVVEPDIQPDEPEPADEPEAVVEPDTAGVGSPHGDPLADEAADPDEPTDPPQAVIDAGEMPAVDLDPNAGWESEDDRTIHADPESGLYHTPDSPGYKIGPDGEVFESEEEAQSAGFTRWDQPDDES